MKKAKKVISIIFIIIMAIVGMGGALAIYTHFTQPSDDKLPVDAVESGVIESEKYGKFIIPEENMFLNLEFNEMMLAQNNTDFTYLYDEVIDNLVRYGGMHYGSTSSEFESVEKFKEKNQMLMISSVSVDAHETIAEKLADPNYPYLNCEPYFYSSKEQVYLALNDNKLQFDEKKMLEFTGGMLPYSYLGLAYVDKNNMNKETNTIYNLQKISSTSKWNFEMAVRCLSYKVTVSVEGQGDYPVYLPVMIISDKGYPMTEKIYEEILQGI